MPAKILLIPALLLISACSKEDTDSSTAKLDAVDVESGSISDAMITLDQAASDGTAIDSSVPADASKKAETPPAAGDDAADDSSPDGDMVITPPASNTALSAPAPITK